MHSARACCVDHCIADITAPALPRDPKTGLGGATSGLGKRPARLCVRPRCGARGPAIEMAVNLPKKVEEGEPQLQPPSAAAAAASLSPRCRLALQHSSTD